MKILKSICALAFCLTLASASAYAAPIGNFDVKDSDGKAFTQAALKGKKSVLIFLQAACGQCRGEIVELKQKAEELTKKADLYLVLVDVNSERALEYFKSQNLPGKLILDPAFSIGDVVDVTATPSTVVIDKDLNVVKSKTGYRSGDLAQLLKDL